MRLFNIRVTEISWWWEQELFCNLSFKAWWSSVFTNSQGTHLASNLSQTPMSKKRFFQVWKMLLFGLNIGPISADMSNKARKLHKICLKFMWMKLKNGLFRSLLMSDGQHLTLKQLKTLVAGKKTSEKFYTCTYQNTIATCDGRSRFSSQNKMTRISILKGTLRAQKCSFMMLMNTLWWFMELTLNKNSTVNSTMRSITSLITLKNYDKY
jgi:hypothetical protein